MLIFDPTGKMEKITEAIGQEEIVDAIVLTHGHFDHIGAVDKLHSFYHCPVYLNLKDEKLARDPHLNSMAQFSGQIHCPVCALVEPTMQIGIFNLDIFEAPGHTAGSTLIGYQNHLFVGDVLFAGSIGRTDLYSASPSAMRSTLKMLRTLNENYLIYPGHDALTTLAKELKTNPYLK